MNLASCLDDDAAALFCSSTPRRAQPARGADHLFCRNSPCRWRRFYRVTTMIRHAEPSMRLIIQLVEGIRRHAPGFQRRGQLYSCHGHPLAGRQNWRSSVGLFRLTSLGQPHPHTCLTPAPSKAPHRRYGFNQSKRSPLFPWVSLVDLNYLFACADAFMTTPPTSLLKYCLR